LANLVQLGFADRVIMTIWLLVAIGTLGLISAIGLRRQSLSRQEAPRDAPSFERGL